MGAWQARGAYRGAVIGLLLGLGWDTSRQTTLLEQGGGHGHLTFAQIIGCGIGGLIGGVVVATLFYALHPRHVRDGHQFM